MREALRFGKTLNPSRPYGALIVDTYNNTISCYGVSTATEDVLLHGEMAAFKNCTQLYFRGDDRNNPGLFWPNQTLYTTAESCPMCAAASVWRGLGRMVYGTDIPTLIRLGSKQMTIRNRELFKQNALSIFKTGGMGAVNSNQVSFLAEGVLREETDQAFYTGFGFQYSPDSRIGTREDVFADQPCGCGQHHDD
jgi:tRNA(adenine34) deaminase